MKELNHKIEISEEAFKLLLDIDKADLAEYRDTEYSSLEDFLENRSVDEENETEEWFLNRNFNGTYYMIYELAEAELIDLQYLCYFITYTVSDKGREIIEQNENR